ncbi:hypothetical protein EV210_111126 [Anaerospora hongkongensis]|uniref:Uncharacterized protein n=1 Tax=Anaerospora hongkongensis TaxID=244830 RepID=A0A4R1PYL8_9FIRM|nr:hypothetical protein [Anaerospora hongkongensis]TCL35660.1 hypothetical protein EV210_111126 [Anaerospora hongkongensis]
MNIQERNEKLNRIIDLEKEIAAIKQELEGRPIHVKVPLRVFFFENPKFRNLEDFSDDKLKELVEWLENELAAKITISVPWW